MKDGKKDRKLEKNRAEMEERYVRTVPHSWRSTGNIDSETEEVLTLKIGTATTSILEDGKCRFWKSLWLTALIVFNQDSSTFGENPFDQT